jgi:integrase
MPDRPSADQPRLCRVAGRDTWHIRCGGRRISTGCTDRAGAVAALARFRAAQDAPPAGTATVGTILARYLADREDAARPGAERLRWAHRPLTARLGETLPEHLTAAACRVYARARGVDGVAPSTVRTELQALTAALHWAVGKHLVAAMPELWLPPRPPGRERWLTREEADRLVASCKAKHVRLAVLLALHTAARIGAVLALTWDRVDLDRRLIDYREPGRAVTRKRRVQVPINDTLLAVLTPAHAAHTCPAVVEYGGARLASLKHGFRDAVTRAGLDGAVTPHTLRHTAITWMVQAGVPLWEVAGLAGLTVALIESTYGHHAPDHLRRAAGALG